MCLLYGGISMVSIYGNRLFVFRIFSKNLNEFLMGKTSLQFFLAWQLNKIASKTDKKNSPKTIKKTANKTAWKTTQMSNLNTTQNTAQKTARKTA